MTKKKKYEHITEAMSQQLDDLFTLLTLLTVQSAPGLDQQRCDELETEIKELIDNGPDNRKPLSVPFSVMERSKTVWDQDVTPIVTAEAINRWHIGTGNRWRP